MYRNTSGRVILGFILQFVAAQAFCTGIHRHKLTDAHRGSYYHTAPADSVAKLWLEDFRAFRNAVYRKDTAAVKKFFKFPLQGDTWFLVLSEKELQSKSTDEKFGAFSAGDFDKYYSKIFSAHFIASLLKVKSEELYRKGRYETPELRENSTSTYKMSVSFDKEERRLSLNLNFSVVEKDEQGEILDGGESTVIYTFRVLRNGHLQFDKIMMAG